MKQKQGRGRPKGSEIASDQKILNDVADLIVKEPGLKPTTAIKRVQRDWTETVVHRLLGKWRIRSEELIAAATKRREANAAPTGSGLPAINCNHIGRFGYPMKETAAMRAARGVIEETAAVRAARGICEASTITAARELTESLALRYIHQIENDPTVKFMRQVQNDPAMKVMRDYMQDYEQLRRMGLTQIS